jgi:hypothetical protein
MAVANNFILWDLASQVKNQESYRSGLYWRFLYEKCGGMKDGTEDPEAGMRVIRHIFETLYSREIFDFTKGDDLVRYIPLIMDHVLADSLCPFHSHQDSLAAFAKAIMQLHFSGGRCSSPGIPAGCGFYDPHGVYVLPSLSYYDFTGRVFSTLPKYLQINNSFGINLVMIRLYPESNGLPVLLEFNSDPEAQARFQVEVLQLLKSSSDDSYQLIASLPAALSDPSKGSVQFYIPPINAARFNALALIITRVDSDELLDPDGFYSITLSPVE